MSISAERKDALIKEFATKEGVDATPAGYMPWFDVPNRQTEEVMVAFGHWSTAGGLWRPNVVCLDTGCVWGRQLSAMRLSDRRVLQVQCPDCGADGV